MPALLISALWLRKSPSAHALFDIYEGLLQRRAGSMCRQRIASAGGRRLLALASPASQAALK